MDTATGLYSLRARYYNPALGRFLSGDTYPVDVGNPVEFNRYVYTANGPINRVDPSGNLFIEYTPNLLQSAARGAALGSLGGAVYGIVASLACGFNAGSFAKAVIGGAIGGAMIGAAVWTGVAGLPGLVTIGFGTAGAISSYDAMRAYGANPCTVLSALASVATVFTGFAGIVGGTPMPPGLQPVWVGANSGTSTSAVSGIGVSPDVLTGLGAISLASMISGEVGQDGGGDNEKPRPTYEEYKKEYEYTVFRLKHALMAIKQYQRIIETTNDPEVVQSMKEEILLTQRDAIIWHQLGTKILQQAIEDGFDASSWPPLPPLPWL